MTPRRFFQLALLLVATVVPLAAGAILDASSQHRTPRRGGPTAYAVGFDSRTSTTFFGLLSIGSGTFVPIAELPASGQGLGRDRQRHLYTVDTANNLVRINPANGLTKVVGSTGVTTPGPLGDILVDVFASMRTGELFLMDYDNNLYSVDSKTGAATFVGGTGIPPISSFRYSSSLAGDCRYLYSRSRKSMKTSTSFRARASIASIRRRLPRRSSARRPTSCQGQASSATRCMDSASTPGSSVAAPAASSRLTSAEERRHLGQNST